MPSMDDLMGSIDFWALDWAPRNWALCNGQILNINQNQALFSLFGTTYGGNGQTTFALPDLRSRVPIGFGTGTGLPTYNLGQVGGEISHTLNLNEIPMHNHMVSCNGTASGRDLSNTPVGKIPAKSSSSSNNYSLVQGGQMAADMLGNTGANQGHENMMPYIVINYIVCLYGIYPSRS